MTRARAAAAAALLLGCALTGGTFVSAQGVQTRDTIVRPTGTARISGRIITDDADARPVRRASVTLASGALQLPQVVVSDDDGSFAFTGLAPGSYTLMAQKPSYVPTFFGSKQAGKGPGVPIALIEGQHLDGVQLHLLHGAVISGTVRNQSGQPVVNLDVQAVPVQLAAAQRLLTIPSGFAAQVAAAGAGGGTGTTDDRGVYRIYGLSPGPYVVESRSDSLSMTELHRVSEAEVKWAVTSASQASALSPGMPAPPLDPAPAQTGTVNYAPVYFPGTTDAASATTVTLTASEERTGIDFTTQLVPTARVSGLLLDADGRPASAGQISLRSDQNDAMDLLSALIGGGGSRTGADGRFSLQDVAPGRYTITARATVRQPNAKPVDPAMEGMPPGLLNMLGMGGASPTLWATADVDVQGQDVTNVTLTLQSGMTVSGKIVFEGASAPVDPTKTRVSLTQLPTSANPIALATSMVLGGGSIAASADGKFQIKGVLPDRYRIGAGSGGLFGLSSAMLQPGITAAGGWVLKSAMLGGRDVADVPFDVRPNQDIANVVVTMTDRPTELTGTVLDGLGRPAPGFPIVVFSTDRAYWTIGSRRVQQARPASDGKYKLTGLPAGEYYVSAVTDLDPNDLYEPAFLEQLIPQSFKISLADAEKKTTDLRLGGG